MTLFALSSTADSSDLHRMVDGFLVVSNHSRTEVNGASSTFNCSLFCRFDGGVIWEERTIEWDSSRFLCMKEGVHCVMLGRKWE